MIINIPNYIGDLLLLVFTFYPFKLCAFCLKIFYNWFLPGAGMPELCRVARSQKEEYHCFLSGSGLCGCPEYFFFPPITARNKLMRSFQSSTIWFCLVLSAYKCLLLFNALYLYVDVYVYMHRDLKIQSYREIKGGNRILGISTHHIISGKHSRGRGSCFRADFSISVSLILDTAHKWLNRPFVLNVSHNRPCPTEWCVGYK